MIANCSTDLKSHPLPWRVLTGLTGSYTTIVDASGNHVLGYTTDDDGVHGPLVGIVAVMNCHTELLAALKEVIPYLSGIGGTREQYALGLAEDAIAKAEAP